jgi:hypothetical protein
MHLTKPLHGPGQGLPMLAGVSICDAGLRCWAVKGAAALKLLILVIVLAVAFSFLFELVVGRIFRLMRRGFDRD